MPLRLARALGLVVLLISGRLPAQEAGAPASPTPATATTPGPATPAPAAGAACFPACRDGFTCYQGQCISLCNPACPAGLECVEGRRCEPPLPHSSAARPYEPPPPPVKDFADRSHALLGFHLGLPGNVQADDRAHDLDSTLGFNLRADTPVAKYVLLGPMLQFGSWRPDLTPVADHNYYVDLDLVLRFRAPITTSKLNYQLWLGMPIGVSIDKLGDENAHIGLGWNIGVLFGGAVHITPKFGLFAEVGWEQHRMAHDQDNNLPDLDFKLQQALLNLGIVVRN
jgi:hypothetical protein